MWHADTPTTNHRKSLCYLIDNTFHSDKNNPLPPPHTHTHSHALPLYLSICEEEDHVFSLDPGHLVELSQVFVEAVVVVASAQLDLEAVVATHVGRQPGQRLLPCPSHTHQQGVAPLLADHAGYPRKTHTGGRGLRRTRSLSPVSVQFDAQGHKLIIVSGKWCILNELEKCYSIKTNSTKSEQLCISMINSVICVIFPDHSGEQLLLHCCYNSAFYISVWLWVDISLTPWYLFVWQKVLLPHWFEQNLLPWQCKKKNL